MDANFKKNIIYFDSNCGLCHQFIKIIIVILQPKYLENFYFAPIGGKAFLDDSRVKFINIDSVFIVLDEKVFIEGDAILALLPFLKKRYFFIKFLNFFPKFSLNFIYRNIAANRQRISCYLPKNSKVHLLP